MSNHISISFLMQEHTNNSQKYAKAAVAPTSEFELFKLASHIVALIHQTKCSGSF